MNNIIFVKNILIKSFILNKYIYNMSGNRKSSVASSSSNSQSSTGKKNKISFKDFMRKIMNPKTRAERLCLALMA